MSQYSPFSNATVFNYGDGELTLESDTSDVISVNPKLHIIKDGETLASIAFRYYGDSGYWGRIANYNKILNPFTEVTPGKQIMIP